MSRIRSIHPGFLTDEATMVLTVEAPLAALLAQGLWIEADDWGTFEWKPLTLKARILPAIGADVMMQMLAILQRADINMVRRFEIDGKHYGVVRNFARAQRPKSPKRFHPTTPETRSYAGFLPDGTRPRSELGGPLSGGGSEPNDDEPSDSSEQVQDEFRTGSEKTPQMEDGGWREGGSVEPIPLTGAESRKRPRAKPKTSISADAEPDETDREHALSEGMTELTLRHEFLQFRAHHLAKASAFSDWHQAWRTWVGNWVKFGKRQIGEAFARAGPALAPKRIPAVALFEQQRASYDETADEPYIPNAGRSHA